MSGELQLPERQPDSYSDNRWPVDIWDDHFQQLRTGSLGGEVNIRMSDGRISFNGIPTPLGNADNARRAGLALLAAADRWDELFPEGVTPKALKQINVDYRARWQ